MNLPNKLTILRLVMIPLFVATFYLTVLPCNYLISAVIFVLAALTDFLDGYIARKHNLVTNLGKFLDPIADKVLVGLELLLRQMEKCLLQINQERLKLSFKTLLYWCYYSVLILCLDYIQRLILLGFAF